MLFIHLFVKTDTCRHLVCHPTHLPAVMAQALAPLSSCSLPPPGSPLTITHPNLGEFESCTPAQKTK